MGDKVIQILELFGGIGAPRKALENLNIDIKSVDYVEIMKYAVVAYNQMFDNSYKPQNILDWNMDVDILIHGSPCQDWSNNGLNNISTGRSILYERTLEIIEKELKERPKVVIWENVTGLINKRNISHFNHYLQTMEKLGYTNSFQVLNAVDYNSPQHRERIFVVSRIDGKKFKFPKPVPLTTKLTEFLETDPEIERLSDNEMSLFFKREDGLYIYENTKLGYRKIENGDSINVERPNSKTRRGRVGKGIVKTITTSKNTAVYIDGILRKLTAREYWRIMGFSDKDFDQIEKQNIPAKYKQTLIGNSISVPVLEAIFRQLLLKEVEDED